MAEARRDGELLILGTYFGVQKIVNAVEHGFIDRFLVTIDALADHLWEHQEQAARGQQGTTVLLLNPHLEPSTNYLDCSGIDRHFEKARAAFMQQLGDARIALTVGTSPSASTSCPA